MRTIKNESELPEPASNRAAWQGFLRLKSDPAILQDCGTGELFRREDGKNWKQPAYVREREFELSKDPLTGEVIRIPKPWEPLQARGSYCDSEVFPYSEMQVA